MEYGQQGIPKKLLFCLFLMSVCVSKGDMVTVNLTVDAYRFVNDNTPIIFNTRGYNG